MCVFKSACGGEFSRKEQTADGLGFTAQEPLRFPVVISAVAPRA